jgi:hypothetical protein
MTSLRQQLFDAIRARFETIRTVNGYETEIGRRFFVWRDMEKSPFTTDELSQGGAFTIRDTTCSSTARIITSHDHDLTIECVAATIGAPPDNWARRIAADLHKAIGVDRQWTVNGTKLAMDTMPGDDELNVGHFGDRIGAVRKTFVVKFRTAAFDPYNQ